jgi:phospholipid/cholesterol/gamma-HCH transport system substrate-binding protein
MKRDNVNYLLVGSFVLAMSLLLFYALYRITGQSAKGDIYYTQFANVAGIKTGSLVTFEGYEVGNVTDIEPVLKDNRTWYRLTLNLRKPVHLPTDSKAIIAVPGMLASPLVEIKEGQKTEVLALGGEIQSAGSSNMMEAVASLATDVGKLTETTIKPLLVKMNDRVDSLGGSLEKNLPAAMDDMRSTLAHLNTTAGRVETLFSPENQKNWSGLLKNSNEATADLLKLSRDLHGLRDEVHELVKDSHDIVNSSGKELQLSLRRTDTLLYQLEATGRNLNEFSRNIRENPAALVQGKPPVDAAGEPQ